MITLKLKYKKTFLISLTVLITIFITLLIIKFNSKTDDLDDFDDSFSMIQDFVEQYNLNEEQ